MDLAPGRPVRITATREETTAVARLPDGTLRLSNGRAEPSHALWPLELEGALLERLALGDLDAVDDFVTRLDILHLMSLREADGLGSFLGGRVRLFPHQLHVAERATANDPVRWLLADEVGLGKTIEASLILNRLAHTGKIERCLVVAPDALTVQWLGELWRKYHQVFTLLDAQRLADVSRDFGSDFNPFDLHRRAVIALEMLTERPHLTEQAVKAGIDLLVVDEAQRLRRPKGHLGEPPWRAVAPIAALGRHVLLLSATPPRRRRSWILPPPAAAAPAGIARRDEFRGAARDRNAPASVHQLDPTRRHRRLAAEGGYAQHTRTSQRLATPEHD